ncbi:hypothetical protein WN48_04687 [Eufriesea mexicana]|nr:hypothetical protein WN48_04687 [Eufriesea mexicana]
MGGTRVERRWSNVNRSGAIWLIKLASVYAENRVTPSNCASNAHGLCRHMPVQLQAHTPVVYDQGRRSSHRFQKQHWSEDDPGTRRMSRLTVTGNEFSTKALAGAKTLGGFLYSAVNKAGKTVVEAGAKIKKTVEENVSNTNFFPIFLFILFYFFLSLSYILLAATAAATLLQLLCENCGPEIRVSATFIATPSWLEGEQRVGSYAKYRGICGSWPGWEKQDEHASNVGYLVGLSDALTRANIVP